MAPSDSKKGKITRIRTPTRRKPLNSSKQKRKLLQNAEVELRSEEEGFQGSWHPGTVISVDSKRRRHVKYHHFVHEDGSANLVDVISVSPIFDGIDSGDRRRTTYYRRGNLRPLPPKMRLLKSKLCYGMCVDVFYNDAWWDGVIFDCDLDSEERMIFFPDLGDELKSGIDALRISQDWDEATDNWQERGNWVFLELIEKYKLEWRIAGVSVKQIWYDVRDKEEFEDKIKEWTCPFKDLWEELVVEVINDNINITVEAAMLRVLNVPKCLSSEAQETCVELASADPVDDDTPCPLSLF